jgi:hypothetical protein
MCGSAIHVCELKVVEISRFLRFIYPLFWKEISVDTVIDTVENIKIRELPTKVTNQQVPSETTSCAIDLLQGAPLRKAPVRLVGRWPVSRVIGRRRLGCAEAANSC